MKILLKIFYIPVVFGRKERMMLSVCNDITSANQKAETASQDGPLRSLSWLPAEFDLQKSVEYTK